jgi:hypothetical protein
MSFRLSCMNTFIRRVAPYIVSCVLVFAGTTAFVSAQGLTSDKTGVTESAQKAGYDVASVAACSRQSGGCIPVIIGNVVSGLLGVFGALFLALIIWGGARWMFAGGETKNVQAARETIKNAVIGMLIVAASYAIVNYVLVTVSGATSGGGVTTEAPAP